MAKRIERLRTTLKEQQIVNKQRWKENHPDRFKDSTARTNAKKDRVMDRYKITSEERSWRLLAQGSRCGICETRIDKGHLDHDHQCCDKHGSCGSCLRSILCAKCNMIVAVYENNQYLFPAIEKYLDLYSEETNHASV